jgi:formylglycine-generating enzyme required for sulfatase activity
MSSLKPNEPFSTRYHLVRRIGVGGYSEVWLANDTLAGNMQVALKIFAPDKGLDEQGIALFSKEYALVFNLNHPNLLIPKHFDVAEGSPFLVLPYCPSGSIFSKIGNMTEAELAKFMLQAASAIAYLHSQEPPIIHQDIKPDNFLIDNQGNYLLSDFGISSKIRRTLTRSMGAQGSTGTMAYMPPEKFSADKQIIKAGDIFSLGVTMYELLTGDLPFGDNGGLTLKAGADVPNLRTGFSSELNELLKRCMAKETWDRPMAEELQRIADGYLKTGKWNTQNDSDKDYRSDKDEENTNSPIEPAINPVGQSKPEEPQTPSYPTQSITPSPKPPVEPNGGREKRSSSKPIKYFIYFLFGLFFVIAIPVAYYLWPSSQVLAEKSRQDSFRYKTFNVNGVNFEMAFIKGSTFQMGSNGGRENEMPVHEVSLSDVYLGKTEVTQALWKAVMDTLVLLSDPSYFKGDNLPVENVSWNDAQKFITKLNNLTGKKFRLPTEAEWEYAAGGGGISRTILSGTDYEKSLGDFAWYWSNSVGQTHAVATKRPNFLGLYDMNGNVWEWCSDLYGTYNQGSQSNPLGSSTGSERIFRGGSWANSPACCRVAYRSSCTPDICINYIGFRVALAP